MEYIIVHFQTSILANTSTYTAKALSDHKPYLFLAKKFNECAWSVTTHFEKNCSVFGQNN